MVKCTKSQIRKLKTVLRWKLPAAQRERIQMVLYQPSKTLTLEWLLLADYRRDSLVPEHF